MIQMQSSNLVDPFQKESFLSLNPRTFRHSEDTVKSNDLEAIHQLMNSMALQNSGKHFEEAKSILGGGSEKPQENTILEQSFQIDQLQEPEDFFAAVEKLENAKKETNRQKGIEDLNETNISTTDRQCRPEIQRRKSIYKHFDFSSQSQNDTDSMENEQPKENRFSLARKRAKFSMKPTTSLAANFVEPTLDIEHLQDPEEFFAAVEKFENAKKEINRLTGREDLNEPKFPTGPRERRPELPRRKSVYKHHVFPSQPENKKSLIEKRLKDDIGSQPTQSQPTQNSQQKSVTPNCESVHVEKPGGSKDKNDDLVDVLMSTNVDGLNENEINSYLKDLLKIKPIINTDNLKLPEIPSVKNLIGKHSILPLTNAFPDTLTQKTLGKQKKLPENLILSLSSPTLSNNSKSPFLSISTFGKHLAKSVQPSDLFSARDTDLFPATTSGNIPSNDDVSKDKEFLVSESFGILVKNKIPRTPVGNVSRNVPDENLINSRESDNLSEPMISVEENVTAEDLVQKETSPTNPNLNVEDFNDTVDPQFVQDNVEDMTEQVGPTSPQVNEQVSTIEELEIHSFQSAQTDDNDIENLNASMPAQNQDIIPEQNQENTKKFTNNRKKTMGARKVDLKKRRQSLAEAGTSYVSGVRKSNRIKRKPLQFWKGERLLYGRVHNSLPTVIGVKYLSPTNEKFKVESYVSDKYKDLVELTALH